MVVCQCTLLAVRMYVRTYVLQVPAVTHSDWFVKCPGYLCTRSPSVAETVSTPNSRTVNTSLVDLQYVLSMYIKMSRILSNLPAMSKKLKYVTACTYVRMCYEVKYGNFRLYKYGTR